MDRVFLEHVDHGHSVAGFFDEDGAEVIEGIGGVEIEALFDFLEEVSEVEAVDVGIELEPFEVAGVEGLGRLEVSFAMDAFVEDYFEVSLKGLHKVGNIGSRDVSFRYRDAKSTLANSIDPFPYLLGVLSVPKDHIQETYHSSLLVVLLALPVLVPFGLDHHAVLDVPPEQILEGTGNDLSLNDSPEPVEPGPLVHDTQVPHVETRQMDHFL